MNNSAEKLNRAAAKASFYSLMAQAVNYPDKELIESLSRGEFTQGVMDALQVLGIEIPHDLLEPLHKEYTKADKPPKDLLLQMERDYTWMCFASKPRLVYLFESVYNEGKLFDESTFRIARLYYDAGLKVEENFRLPPDHIAIELEFMAFLAFKEMDGIQSGDSKIEDYAVELQKTTLNEHLHHFALSVAGRLGKNAKTTFYRSVANVMTAFFSNSSGMI